MKSFQRFAFLLVFVFGNYFVTADILVYPFADQFKEERFNLLIKELRCPKCQNNNLADSNAPLAVDLKDIVYEKINAGETDEEIILYLKQRYGDFISYRPPVKPSTWLIWYGPFIILFVGCVLIYRFVSGRQKNQSVKVAMHSTASSDLLEQWVTETSTDTANSKSESQNLKTEQGDSK